MAPKPKNRPNCPVCGLSVVRGNATYCSRTCYDSVALKPLKSCEVCGSEYKPQKKTTRFCSKTCSGIFHRGTGRPRIERVACECGTCGEPMALLPKHVSRGQGVYCSRECSAVGRRRDVNADWLRIEYLRKRRSVQDISRELRTGASTINKCLVEAGIQPRNQVEAARLKAERRRRHTGVRKRLLAGELPTGTCAWCDDSVGIEFHHLNGVRSDDRAENLLPLCHSCHSMAEWLIRKATPGILATGQAPPLRLKIA